MLATHIHHLIGVFTDTVLERIPQWLDGLPKIIELKAGYYVLWSTVGPGNLPSVAVDPDAFTHLHRGKDLVHLLKLGFCDTSE